MDVNLGDAIDMATFNQILEMDDTDEREFSSSIVFDFFEQVEKTFLSMDKALFVQSDPCKQSAPYAYISIGKNETSKSYRRWATTSRAHRQLSASSACATAAKRSSDSAS